MAIISIKKQIDQLDVNPENKVEYFMKTYWRPAMAWTYMIICVFDFLIMPTWVEKTTIKPEHAIELAKKMPEKDQVMALQVLTKESVWNPLTLRENGFFHIAMMAVLGVAAWTRGREKEELIKIAANESHGDNDYGNRNRSRNYRRQRIDNPDN